MYDSSVPFNDEELKLIADNGVDIAELRDFYERFPDQTLESAIGGLKMEKEAKAAGLEPALESSVQDAADAPAVAPIAPPEAQEAGEGSVTPEEVEAAVQGDTAPTGEQTGGVDSAT